MKADQRWKVELTNTKGLVATYYVDAPDRDEAIQMAKLKDRTANGIRNLSSVECVSCG